jgi:sigma-E factor negative regulatory protein RseB
VLSIEARTKVAGRSTSILHLRPRDGLRLGYRLAIDDISGLILRSESLGGDGRLLERHEYASVSITPNDGAVGTQFSQADEQAEITLMQDLELVGLPLGYRGRLARGSEQRALFVSDGIASATVVFEPLPNGLSPGEGAARRGATLTYSRGSIVGGAGVLVTVIGEVPLPAARLIADAVKVVPRR